MKRYAILFELLVALLLTTTLLGALSTLIFYFTGVSKEVDKALKEPIKIALTEQRLHKVLKTALTLYSNEEGLTFLYNRGVDPDRRFSADVLGKLYVEDEKLILATWPNPNYFPEKPPPYITEVIYEGVEKWGYTFYNPPPLSERKDPSSIPYGWQPEWKVEWNALPLLCRITLNDHPYTIAIQKGNHLLVFPKAQNPH